MSSDRSSPCCLGLFFMSHGSLSVLHKGRFVEPKLIIWFGSLWTLIIGFGDLKNRNNFHLMSPPVPFNELPSQRHHTHQPRVTSACSIVSNADHRFTRKPFTHQRSISKQFHCSSKGLPPPQAPRAT